MKIPNPLKNDNLAIHVVSMTPQLKIQLHGHDFYELVVIFGGEGIHYTHNDKYHINQGDVFLIRPGIEHGYDNTKDLQLVNIIYSPEVLKLPLYDLVNLPGYHAFFEVEPAMRKQHRFKSRLCLGSSQLEYLKKLIELMDKELKSREPSSLFIAVAYFMQIIGFIARSCVQTKVPEQLNILSLGKVISYIESNYQNKITIAELAKKASMSKVTLYRMFKKTFSMSPLDYIISVRIAAASHLLNTSDIDISEIAWRTGFTDSNYFSRIFKKYVGVSPRSYRQRNFN
ncbi:MAG: helix-turn-helix domain-containing protein [Victivallales bacterium]|nr:helix-turn-helix domain-containing protein [Victivallales bacterium]